MNKNNSKTSRMMQLLNYRLKITIHDGRMFIGQMIAFDKYMNLVLADTQEIRKPTTTNATLKTATTSTTNQNQIAMERRTLGLLILRGDIIISMSVEAPPPATGSTLEKVLPTGPGIARSQGRGLPISTQIPTGLAGPVGGSLGGFMQPSVGRGSMPPMPPGFKPPPGFQK